MDAVVHRMAARPAQVELPGPPAVGPDVAEVGGDLQQARPPDNARRDRPVDLRVHRLKPRRLPDHQRGPVLTRRRRHRVEIGERQRDRLLDHDRLPAAERLDRDRGVGLGRGADQDRVDPGVVQHGGPVGGPDRGPGQASDRRGTRGVASHHVRDPDTRNPVQRRYVITGDAAGADDGYPEFAHLPASASSSPDRAAIGRTPGRICNSLGVKVGRGSPPDRQSRVCVTFHSVERSLRRPVR